MSATFLVTGFEPFGEQRTHSSGDALEQLREHWPLDVVIRRLPMDQRAARATLRRARDEFELLLVPHQSSDHPIERIAAAVTRVVDARRMALQLDASQGFELECLSAQSSRIGNDGALMLSCRVRGPGARCGPLAASAARASPEDAPAGRVASHRYARARASMSKGERWTSHTRPPTRACHACAG